MAIESDDPFEGADSNMDQEESEGQKTGSKDGSIT
jgi:hypothetical protein